MKPKVKATRRKYGLEFKLETAKLVLEKGLSRAEVARDLGLSPSMLSRWVEEYQRDQANAFPGKGRLKPDEARIKQLEEENRRLRMERDILKKATAYFAKISD
jgi:transposase